MSGIGEEHIIKAASDLGIKGIGAYFASNSLSLVLQEAIKQIPAEKLVEILEKKGLSVIKNHVGLPTTKITLGIEQRKILEDE